jgi:hypothetical protein
VPVDRFSICSSTQKGQKGTGTGGEGAGTVAFLHGVTLSEIRFSLLCELLPFGSQLSRALKRLFARLIDTLASEAAIWLVHENIDKKLVSKDPIDRSLKFKDTQK